MSYQSNRLAAVFREEEVPEERPSGRLPKLDMHGGLAVPERVESGRLLMALLLSSEEAVEDEEEVVDPETGEILPAGVSVVKPKSTPELDLYELAMLEHDREYGDPIVVGPTVEVTLNISEEELDAMDEADFEAFLRTQEGEQDVGLEEQTEIERILKTQSQRLMKAVNESLGKTDDDEEEGELLA